MVPVVMGVEQLSAQFNIGSDPGVGQINRAIVGAAFYHPLWHHHPRRLGCARGRDALSWGSPTAVGFILTALLFALVHSNYGISMSTLIVLTGLGPGCRAHARHRQRP